MARSLQEQLDSVDAAMEAIENGVQSYTERNKGAVKARYEALCKRHDMLSAKLNRASTSPFRLAKFSRAVGA